MSFIQRFLMAVFPPAWAKDMHAESQKWKLACACGCERSVWELGGVRWKAKGNPRRWMVCPQCGQGSWHKVIYRVK